MICPPADGPPRLAIESKANKKRNRYGWPSRRRAELQPCLYVELHTSSAFSFLDGASLPETLVERAAALGYPALALLDRDGVYGAPQFTSAARKAGLKAIVGAELTIRTRQHA